jgi:hypothetical protein
MSAKATEAPACAKACAMALPIPRAAPVTTTTAFGNSTLLTLPIWRVSCDEVTELTEQG